VVVCKALAYRSRGAPAAAIRYRIANARALNASRVEETTLDARRRSSSNAPERPCLESVEKRQRIVTCDHYLLF
jgi:hypothetical protein